MSPQENFWPGVFAIVLGTFMAVLDTSIVNIAIPEMMNVFGASTEEIQWVVTSYTLTMAAVIPLAGFLGIRFGIKKSYLASLFLFTLGSLLCGLAVSNATMIAARIIQAAGGGLMMTIGQVDDRACRAAGKNGASDGSVRHLGFRRSRCRADAQRVFRGAARLAFHFYGEHSVRDVGDASGLAFFAGKRSEPQAAV